MPKKNSEFLPFKTADGKQIRAGNTYFVKWYMGHPTLKLKCVSQNLINRYWYGRRTDGKEEQVKVWMTKHRVFATEAGLHKAEVAEQKRVVARAKRVCKAAARHLAKEQRRLDSLTK